MKALNHNIFLEIIRQRQQDHALVVSHIGTHNLTILTCSAASRSEIDRFKKPVGPHHPKFFELLQVFYHLPWSQG